MTRCFHSKISTKSYYTAQARRRASPFICSIDILKETEIRVDAEEKGGYIRRR